MIAVAVLGAVVFVPAVAGGWVFDDHSLIANNPFVHSFHHWPRWFATDFWNVDQEVVRFGARIIYWRPVVTATYAADWQWGGGSPLAFHLTNLVLEAVMAGLAFVTLRRWIGATWPAFAAVLVFAVHPTKAESVAWIAGRTDILCMLALLVAGQGVARRLRREHGGLALEITGTIMAYLCKEQAIVLPCFVVVEAWVAAGRPELDRAHALRLIRAALPQAIIAIGYLAVRTVVLPIGAVGVHVGVPPVDHALAVLETLGRFAALAVVPHDLSIQQGIVHAIHHSHATGYVVTGAVTTVALIAAAIATRRRAPAVAIGLGFYLVTLAPTSNLVYTGMATLVSERFLYLPVFGLVLALGYGLAIGERRFGRRIYAIAAVIVVIFATLTIRRSADYRSEDTFWARELHIHPDSLQARLAVATTDSDARHFYPALADPQLDRPYDSIREELILAFQVASLLSQVVPDHHTADLEQIDRFARDVLAHTPASLDLQGAHFTLDLANVDDSKLVQARPRFLALRADLQSRLGHDADAIALAESAVAECPRCVSLVTMDALVLARAGRYDDSLAVLDAVDGFVPEQALALTRSHVVAARDLHIQAMAMTGPAALQAYASELGKLELWGRAYGVLAPYETEIAAAPRFAVGFAELAFRAGEPDVARRVLAQTMTPAAIDGQLATWTEKMGWTR